MQIKRIIGTIVPVTSNNSSDFMFHFCCLKSATDVISMHKMAPPLSRVIVNLYYTSEETKVSLVKHTISVVNMFSSRKGTNTVDFP
jgi:hypothetical protein